jgi:hypothetical protein
MADLMHLMDELEDAEHREEEADYKNKAGRPSLAPTEATTPMSPEEGDMDDDDDDDDLVADDEEWDTANVEKVDIPIALQEAKQQQQQQKQKQKSQKQIHYDNDEEHEQGALLVPNELYGRIHHLWMQERHGPKLLPYDEDAVEELKRRMDEQQDLVDSLESTGQAVESLLATLGQMDLDRAKFALSDWLTCRLNKIEAHPLYMRDCIHSMSDAELEYLKHYGELMEHHLRQTVLDHVPDAWQKLDDANMIDRPEEEGYHFWLVRKAFRSAPDALEHDVRTCLVAKYKDMKKPLEQGEVEIQF